MKTMNLQPILIIDDDIEDRFLIEIAFKELGRSNDITFAENGQRALDELHIAHDSREVLPKLVVLDLNMPKMSGTEVLRQIKQHDEYKHIEVVIFSTAISDWDKKECLKYGVKNYMVKPLTYVEFLNTAQSFCDLAAKAS